VGFVARVVATVIGAIVSLAASGCGGRSELPPAYEGVGGAGAGGGAGSAPGGASAGGRGDAGSGGDARAPAWPVTLRLVNVGSADVLLPDNGFVTCGFSISVAPAGDATASRLTSATPPDAWCDCSRCRGNSRPVCEATDPICDGPPARLAAGKHVDVEWDGRIAVTGGAPPAGSECPHYCDHWEDVVTPGDYLFTIETWDATFTAPATLPAPAGVVTLAIGAAS
jgi:hypothetical protein